MFRFFNPASYLQWAHHACIQRWIDEKHDKQCEVRSLAGPRKQLGWRGSLAACACCCLHQGWSMPACPQAACACHMMLQLLYMARLAACRRCASSSSAARTETRRRARARRPS